MVLELDYFQTPDTIILARSLVGKYLCRARAGQIQHYLVTEVEAYHGVEDKACHARFGATARTQVMFGPGGMWYVYLCYGIHWLLNIVTGPQDYPAAVLIRGVDVASGPGRVTKLLQIDRQFNGVAATPKHGMWFEDLGFHPQQVLATPRIGISYAEEYQHLPWRFVLAK